MMKLSARIKNHNVQKELYLFAFTFSHNIAMAPANCNAGRSPGTGAKLTAILARPAAPEDASEEALPVLMVVVSDRLHRGYGREEGLCQTTDELDCT
jgi:hypothetical protein